MAGDKFILVEKKEGVARITLARPKHNVLNVDMIHELNRWLENLLEDKELKCVVLLGQGTSFCAGVEVGDHKPDKVGEMITAFSRIFLLLDRLEIPTIAAVQGICLGGGMELAIACDMVVASEKASFGQPEIKLGFLPPYAAVRLPEMVGVSKALEICTTGKRYSAQEAVAMGFVTRAVPVPQFEDAVAALVGEIATSSALIIRLNKRAVKSYLNRDLPGALEGVGDLFLNTLMKTQDTMEGIRSFEEKRPPQWRNC